MPTILRIEHAWVLEPAGSQLITARSNITLHHDAEYMSEHRSTFTHQRLTVRRRPYMSTMCPASHGDTSRSNVVADLGVCKTLVSSSGTGRSPRLLIMHVRHRLLAFLAIPYPAIADSPKDDCEKHHRDAENERKASDR